MTQVLQQSTPMCISVPSRRCDFLFYQLIWINESELCIILHLLYYTFRFNCMGISEHKNFGDPCQLQRNYCYHCLLQQTFTNICTSHHGSLYCIYCTFPFCPCQKGFQCDSCSRWQHCTCHIGFQQFPILHPHLIRGTNQLVMQLSIKIYTKTTLKLALSKHISDSTEEAKNFMRKQ